MPSAWHTAEPVEAEPVVVPCAVCGRRLYRDARDVDGEDDYCAACVGRLIGQPAPTETWPDGLEV